MMYARRLIATVAAISALVFAPVRAAAPVVVNLAGSGPAGWDNGLFAGEGTAAADAYLNAPTALARTADGRILIADYWNDRIRSLDAGGFLSTFAGDGFPGNLGDATALGSSLWGPWGVALRGSDVVFTDTFNSAIRAVRPNGALYRLAGVLSGSPGSQGNPWGGWSGFSGDGGPATQARLNWPLGMCSDRNGNIYVADSWNQRVRRIGADGIITTVAGNGWSDGWGRGRYAGDGGSATQASLNWPTAVAVDGAGNLFIADTYNHRIRRVDAASKIITTVAGNGQVGDSGDGGPAHDARLNHPAGLAFGPDGRLFIADSMNHRIRALAGGSIVAVAGNGQRGLAGDNGPALDAQFNEPRDIVCHPNGDVVVADTGNNRIRMVMFGQTTLLTGVVRDANDLTPIPGAAVSWNGIQTTADASGGYSLPIYEGAQTVVVRKPTYGVVTENVSVASGGERRDFLLPSGFVLARVADEAGHIVPNALVAGAENQGLTGPDARVTLRLPPGAHALAASRDGYGSSRPTTVTIAPGQTAEARLTVYRVQSHIVPMTYNLDWISSHANPGDFNTPAHDHAFPAEELPPANSIFSLPTAVGTIDFEFPDTADGRNNALRVNGQTFSVPPGRYANLHLLEASQFGPFSGNLNLIYAGGAETPIATVWSDWAWDATGAKLGPHESVAILVSHRHQAGNPNASPPVSILHMALPVDPNRDLIGFRLPADGSENHQDPRLFAATLSAVGGPQYGDVDGSGQVTPADARMALRAVAGLDALSLEAGLLADVWPVWPDGTFGDGAVDLEDALQILRMAQ